MARVGYWLAVLVAAGVTVAGCLVAYAGYQRESDPAAVVRDYFAALARGDAPAALALGTSLRSGAYLTSEVLREQLQVAPITGVRVDDVAGTGDTRSVEYSTVLRFASGARTVTGRVDVRRADGRWGLTRTAVRVHLDPLGATSRFTIAGTAVPDGAVALFPAAVPVLPDTPNLRPLDSGVVAFDGDKTVSVGVEMSAAGRQAVLAALRKQLLACFPGRGPSGAQCPLPSGPRVVPTSVRGTLHTKDLDRLECTVSSNASGAIGVRGSVKITGSYEHLDANNLVRTVRGTFGVDVNATTPSVGPPQPRFVAT